MVSFERNVRKYKGKNGHIFPRARQTRSLPSAILFVAVICFGFVGWIQRGLQVQRFESQRHSLYYGLTRWTKPIKPGDWDQFVEDYKDRFGGGVREAPASLKQWLDYANRNECNEREFYSTVDDDLQFFRDIVTKSGHRFRTWEIIPFGMQQTNNFMGFQLQNHKLTVVASRDFNNNDERQRIIEEKLRWLLEPVRKHSPPIEAAYFFDLHDLPHNATAGFHKRSEPPESSSRPIFSACKQAYWTDGFSVPTDADRPGLLRELQEQVSQYFWHHDYNPYHKDFMDATSFKSRNVLVPYYFGINATTPKNPNGLPFEKRNNSIVWRGSTTGSIWGHSPRFRLIKEYGGTSAHPLSKKVKDIMIDFAFVDVVQNRSLQTLAPGSRVGQELRLDPFQSQEHKYIMDVDGNAFTERFRNLLRWGSLVFKSSRYREWYTERVRPYVDYIPVNYNFSDLLEKVEWAHNHFDLTSKMVEHAQNISKNYLRDEDMRCYVYRLMLEYQTLFEI